MYDILINISGTFSQAIYTRSDAAIGEMCAMAWQWLMAPLVGLVLSYHIILIILDDKKGWGALVKDFVIVLIPLLIAAAIIRPDGAGCLAVDLKREALDARASVTDALAPGFGTAPDALIIESVKSLAGVMDDYLDVVVKASKTTTPTDSIFDSLKAVAGAVALSANYLILGLTGLCVMLLTALMSAVVISQILILDFALAIGAIFLPIGVGLWPVSRTWAMSSLSVMLNAVFSSAALAFAISILFEENGAIHSAVQAAIASMPQETSPVDQSIIVLGSALAIVACVGAATVVVAALPGILRDVFVKLDFRIIGNQ